MKILVTGGAGFMGSSFIRYMLSSRKDVEIVCLDSLTYASDRESLQTVHSSPRFRFVKDDITDRDLVYSLCADEGFDALINYAAETHVDNSIRDSSPFLKSNILAVGVLLDAVNRYGIGRFHQVSTDEVYGDLPIESREEFTEESPLRPNNPYSASKAAADLLVLSYHRTYGTPVTISRSVNNYGKFQNREKFIPHAISSIIRGERIPLYGKGENIRSWIYVDDHSRAVDLILEKGKVGNIYNISSGFEISNISLAGLLLEKMGKGKECISFVSDRPGHDRRYALSCKKLRESLGFRPLVGFDEGLDRTLRWYLEHKDRFL